MKALKKTTIGQLLSMYRYRVRLAKLRAEFYSRYGDVNHLIPNRLFNPDIVKAGNYSYGDLNIITSGDDYKLCIGNYVSIAPEVVFILQAEHYTDHISTYTYKVNVIKTQKCEAFAKGNIVIEDDVWIGYGATIMSGVTVGQGAVIAAGAVVTKDVEPYSIVGGVPAKLLHYRFEKDITGQLEHIDYGRLEVQDIIKYQDALYQEIKSKDDLLNNEIFDKITKM